MKIMRKLLCITLAIAVVLSCVSVVSFAEGESTAKAGFPDVSKDQIYYDAVSTLSNMGVINGYPDGTFGPDKNVTRAEFTAMLMRTLNLGGVGASTAAELPFTDVSDTNSDISWAIPNINTAYGMGVINGYEDATFRPSANVAFEEAVKMIVCTLGYGSNVDVSLTPWYSNYIAIANQIGITKTANQIGQVETPATRACIAQLLYDSLEIDLVENEQKTDKNILNDYLGLIRAEGIISSDGITSLTEPDVNLRDNEVEIYSSDEGETSTYKTDDDFIKDYLGYQIDFYYRADSSGTRTLVFYVIQTAEDQISVVNASNIEMRGTNDLEVRYYENRGADDEKKISLDNDNIVIYNGKLYGEDNEHSAFDADKMIPEVGQLKFIDSDDDGDADIVIINAYVMYYVSNKDTAKVAIVDNILLSPDKDKNLSLDIDKDRNLRIVDKNGKEVSYSSISTGNIICYAKSNENGGTPIKTALVLKDKVTGKITAINGDGSVTIGGNNYFYSNAAPWMSGTGTPSLVEPVTQDSGTYYFDLNGDIIAYTKDVTAENVKYGYLLGSHKEEDTFDDVVEFRVFTSTGSDEYLGTYKNTTVNGVECPSGDEVRAALEETATNGGDGNNEIQQFIKYTTKKSGGKTVFDKIVTATGVTQGKDITTDTLTTHSGLFENNVDGKLSEPITMTYNGSSRTLVSDDTKISIGSATVISVPYNRSDYNDFRKTTVTSSFKNGNEYMVEVFELSKSNVPKYVVLYLDETNGYEAVTSLSPVYVVDKKEEATKDGERMDRISVYQANESNSTTLVDVWISKDSEDSADIQKGDIFRVGFDKYGDATIDMSKYAIYDMDGTNEFGTEIDDNTETDIAEAEFVTIYGNVAARDESVLTVVDYAVTEEEYSKGEYDTTKATNFDVDDFANALVLLYDKEGQDFEITVSEDYAGTIAGLSACTDHVSPSKVLIYMTEGEVKLLCVIP